MTSNNPDWTSLESIRQTFSKMFVDTGYIEKTEEFVNMELEEKPVIYVYQIKPQYGDDDAI